MRVSQTGVPKKDSRLCFRRYRSVGSRGNNVRIKYIKANEKRLFPYRDIAKNTYLCAQ